MPAANTFSLKSVGILHGNLRWIYVSSRLNQGYYLLCFVATMENISLEHSIAFCDVGESFKAVMKDRTKT